MKFNLLEGTGPYGLLLLGMPALAAAGAGSVMGRAMGRVAGLPLRNSTSDRLSEVCGGIGAVALGLPVVVTTIALVGTGFAVEALARRALDFGSASDFVAARAG